jgi:hypothetical protein
MGRELEMGRSLLGEQRLADAVGSCANSCVGGLAGLAKGGAGSGGLPVEIAWQMDGDEF